jgi:hypothetical protein
MLDRQAPALDDRLAPEDIRFNGDPRQESVSLCHGVLSATIAPSPFAQRIGARVAAIGSTAPV